jgi:hypothetical protein
MKLEDVVVARKSEERLEKMKPVLDRIPAAWGKYLPDAGWDDLILTLDKLLAELDPEYEIFQAKEKFGVLRFYIKHTDETGMARVLVNGFESMSKYICEYCGACKPEDKVYARPVGWVKTLCEQCAKDNGVWQPKK